MCQWARERPALNVLSGRTVVIRRRRKFNCHGPSDLKLQSAAQKRPDKLFRRAIRSAPLFRAECTLSGVEVTMSFINMWRI